MSLKFSATRGNTYSLLSLFVLLVLFTTAPLHAADTNWPDALRAMPLASPANEINDANFAPLFLNSFQSNSVVKAIVLMPGATDEFYFFHRATTKLTAKDDNLLSALTALTNHTRIRVHYRAPFLLLHTAEDQLVTDIKVKNEAMVDQLKATPYLAHANYNDRDWNFLRPLLIENLNANFWPPQDTRDSWHFYRHSFAGWNLNGYETLEAIALAGKTTFTVGKSFFKGHPKISFYPDRRLAPK
jgi:hypothetical protein